MKRVLYHYTDYIALSGIITKAELRVNNVLNMNDVSEMSFFLKRVSEDFIEMLGPSQNEVLLEKMKENFEYFRERRYQFSAYAACFSLYDDDAAQWARYGNQGRGVCIGFDEELLKKILIPGISLENVYYNAEEKSKEIASEFVRIVEEYEREIIEDKVSEELLQEYMELIKETLLCSAAYKHPSFACENEVRMVFWPDLAEMNSISPQYHITSERIKKYYPLNLKELCLQAGVKFEDLFVSIKVGPESTQSPEILSDYFCNMGLTEIAEKTIKSECPLRSTLRG